MPQKYIKAVVTVVYWLGCLSGFVFQAKEVCKVYFAFKTSTSISLTTPQDIPTPSVSVCIRYVDILNRSNHEKYGLAKGPPTGGDDTSWKRVFDECSRLTIKEIFELTPSPSDMLKRCFSRTPDMLDISEHDCKNDITSKKYFTQEYICYMFSFPKKIVQMSEIAHSLHNSKITYQLNMINLGPSAVFDITISPDHGLPILSRNFGRIIRQSNYLFVFYRFHKMHRLPPPYDTWCTYDDKEEIHECLRQCRINGMKEINRFPSTEMTSEPLHIKPLSYNDFQNIATREAVRRIISNCRSTCRRLHCLTQYATTTIQAQYVQSHNTSTFVKVMIPEAASVVVTSHARMYLLDFIVYMCSCFGVWFGLSFASFNPMSPPISHFWHKPLKDSRRSNPVSRFDYRSIMLNRQQQDMATMRSLRRGGSRNQ